MVHFGHNIIFFWPHLMADYLFLIPVVSRKSPTPTVIMPMMIFSGTIKTTPHNAQCPAGPHIFVRFLHSCLLPFQFSPSPPILLTSWLIKSTTPCLEISFHSQCNPRQSLCLYFFVSFGNPFNRTLK